jgi:hypothetical protein
MRYEDRFVRASHDRWRCSMKRFFIIGAAVASLAACSGLSDYDTSTPASGTPSHSGTPVYAPIFGLLASISVHPERNS